MAAKIKRQNLIKEILSERLISGYEDLMKTLKGHGVTVTQATLSRDFAEMGVIRAPTPDGPRYVMDEGETGRHIDRLLGFEILSVRHNETMVVIHTLAGRAAGVARYIEQLNRPEIIATLGGYCTVLVVPNSVKNVKRVELLIKQKVYRE